jgi:hypothetical protein
MGTTEGHSRLSLPLPEVSKMRDQGSRQPTSHYDGTGSDQRGVHGE